MCGKISVGTNRNLICSQKCNVGFNSPYRSCRASIQSIGSFCYYLVKSCNKCNFFIEEELKRLKQALSSEKEYGQVAYQYTEPGQSGEKTEEQPPNNEEQEEPFVASPFLDIPQGMVLVSYIFIHGFQFISPPDIRN